MSSLTHGWSGLVLAYAAVEVPCAATLIRRGVEFGRVLASAAVAVPLTVLAGIGTAAINPVLHGLGVGSGSFLELAAGVGVSAGIGYAAARTLARPADPATIHRRGTLIQEVDSGLGVAPRPAAGPRASARPLTRECEASAQHAREQHSAQQPTTGQPAPRGHAPNHRDPSRRALNDTVTLAGIPVAPLDETKHFKLIGTTGTGKSTGIHELLSGALSRGDRAIITDPDGGYLARFKDTSRGDVVLNPFDAGSRKWDLFGEIDNAYDIDQLARSLLPDQGGPDRSWISYARTFFGSVTRQAHEAGVTDIRELYRLLVVADARELRPFLMGTPAQPFLEEHNGRMFDSIRSVTSSAVSSLDYVAQQTTEPLSVRQWVKASNAGVLFIPYKAGQIAALRSTISAWMRLAIFEAMSQSEGDQRLWFVVDELDALGQIDGLKDALARLRKFGGRCVLGFQSIAQVSSTYGSGEAQTIVENCGNTLILRCSGSDYGGTANFASRLIGQREVLRTNTSRSRRPTELLSSTTLSEHISIEPAVMDSQIEQLPDLSGYLKFASVPNWQRVTLANPAHSGGTHARAEARSFWQGWRANQPAAERRGSRGGSAEARDHTSSASRESTDYE